MYFFHAVPFPSFSSARKHSHTLSPHWFPAHAVQIMDGDQNTYKAGFTAAPQTEPLIPYLSTNILYQNNKIKATVNSLDTLGAKIAFICVKLCVEYRHTGTEWTPLTLMMTNDDADDISRRIEIWEQASCVWDLRGKQWLHINVLVRSSLPWKQLS